jgi:ABC-type Fe3+/spermidine/putrescine transport system ATPase subunit
MVFGFLGPNRSGKTTTMRMPLGLITPTAGRGWLNGRALPDPAGLSRIAAMIDEPAFHPWLTGRRNLEVLALCGPPLPGDGAIDAALERVDLTGVASRKVKTYSQGMRQRLGLAAALTRRHRLRNRPRHASPLKTRRRRDPSHAGNYPDEQRRLAPYVDRSVWLGQSISSSRIRHLAEQPRAVSHRILLR